MREPKDVGLAHAKGAVHDHRPSDWGVEEFRLAISLAGADTWQDWNHHLEWVDFAEHRGLHSIWMPEMHFVPGGNAAPLVPLTAFAARTRRLRLATTSLLLPIHHPLQLAEEVAALDHLSGGRVILGLGRGFGPNLFSPFGIDSASKRDRFDVALDLMLRVWRGETSAAAGHPEVELAPGLPVRSRRTHQTPHPLLAVAAFGRKGLEQSARRGLPYLVSPMEPFDQIADNLAFHRSKLPPAVEPRDVVVPIMRSVFVSSDPRSLARARERLGGGERRVPPGKLPHAIARAMEAPLEDRVIVGTRREVIAGLARYREELAMDLLIVRPLVAGVSAEERMASMIEIVEEVGPALR